MNLKKQIIIILSLTSLLIASFCLLYDPFRLILPVKTISFKEPNTTNILPNRVVSNLCYYDGAKYFYHFSKKLPPGYMLYNFSAKNILGAHIHATYDYLTGDGEFSASYSLNNCDYNIIDPVRQAQRSYEYSLDFRSENPAPSNLWLKVSLCGRKAWCNLYKYAAEVYVLQNAGKKGWEVTSICVFYLIGAFLLVLLLVYLNRKIMHRLFLIPKDNSLKMSYHFVAIIFLFLLFPVCRALLPAHFNYDKSLEMYSLPLLYWRILFLFGISALIAYTAIFTSKVISVEENERRISLFVLLLCFFYGTLYFFNNQLSGDGAQYYSWLRSIFIDHDIDFRNEAEYIKLAGWAGGVIGIYPTRIATCLIWLPAYAITHFFLLILNALKVTCFAPDGWSLPYITSITFTSLMASFCGLILNYKLLRRFFSFSVSLLAVVMVYLWKPFFTWTFVHPSYTHAVDFFVFSLLIYYWVITFANRTLKQWLILGTLFFLAVMTREQNIFFGVALITEAFIRYINRDKIKFRFARFLQDYLVFLLPFLGGMTILSLIPEKGDFLHNFLYVPSTYKLNISSAPHVIYGMLFSTTQGLLTITPLVVISFVGLIFSIFVYSQNRKALFLTMICLILLFISQLAYLALTAGLINIQFCIGARYFINCTLLFMLGLGFLFEYISNNRLANMYIKAISWIAVVYYLFINIQYQGHVISYLGEGSPWKIVLNQQADLAYKIIPDVLTKHIYWSEPKFIFYFTKIDGNMIFYSAFFVILFVTCLALFKWLMPSTKKQQ